MPRQIGEILPMGGISPFGADCSSNTGSEFGDFEKRLGNDCAETGSAAGKLPGCKNFTEVTQFLDVTEKVVNVIAKGVQIYGQQQFQNTIKDGQTQMNNGAKQMQDNGVQMNDAMNDYLSNANNFNTINTQLSQITSVISQTQSAISNYDSALSQLDSQIAKSKQAITLADAQLAAARNPANYPRPTNPADRLKVLQQQRADQLAAINAGRDANLAKASLQQQQLDTTTARNNAVAVHNEAVSQAQQTTAQLTQTQAAMSEARDRANRAQNGIRQGQQTFAGGVGTIRNGAERFQKIQEGVTASVESANGIRGTSQILKNIDNERYYSAGAVPFSEGYGMYARQTGNAALINATALVSSGINSAAGAIDQGGDLGEISSQFLQDFGQATLRTGDMMRLSDQLDVASCIFDNQSNPNRVYDGMSYLNSQIAPAFQIGTGIAQTLSPFVPFLGAVSPALPYVGAAAGTFAQGLAQTAVDSVNTAWRDGGLSAKVSNYPQRVGPGGLTIGRPGSLVERESGGPPSAETVAIAGTMITLGETARSIVNTAIGGNANNAARAQNVIQQIAQTGRPPSLRAGEISLRPPVAVPVYVGD